jgi:prepilin-type N-terminal cleavage/methylation domain-containing protein
LPPPPSIGDPMNRRRCDVIRRGFTLVEVMVALAVSGVVLLGARQLFGVVASAAERVPSAASAMDNRRNRERLLRELLGRVEVGTDSTRTYSGDGTLTRFISWCPAAGGWLERCTVELAFTPRGDSVALEAGWSGRRFTVHTGSPPARFLYLRSAANGGAWLPRWGDAAISAPLALIVILGRDTLFLRVGVRG